MLPPRPPASAPPPEHPAAPVLATVLSLALRAAVYLLVIRWLSRYDFGLHAVYGFALGDLGTTMLLSLSKWREDGWLEFANAAFAGVLLLFFCRGYEAPAAPDLRAIAVLATLLALVLRFARHVLRRAGEP